MDDLIVRLGQLTLLSNSVNGMTECREMDKDLNGVASANIKNIPQPLLEDIFHCIGFSKLLSLCRVCQRWCAIIMNNSAPFCRSVVFALPNDGVTSTMETEYPSSTKAETHVERVLTQMAALHITPKANYWRFAQRATTVIFLQPNPLPSLTAEPFGHKLAYLNELCAIPKVCVLKDMLDEYERQASLDLRTERIQKVVYANTRVHSLFFLHHALCQAGTQIVLHNVILYVMPWEVSIPVCLCLMNRAVAFKIAGSIQSVLSDEDAETLRSEAAQRMGEKRTAV